MDSQTIIANLRNTFAYLYLDEISIRTVIDDAGLDARRITFSAQANNNWHAILNEAAKTNQINNLIAVIMKQYGDNQHFREVYNAYLEFIAQGGQIEPGFLAASQEFLFKREDNYYQSLSIKLIAEQLYEWKIIHSSVQDLFFSTESVSEVLDLFMRNKSDLTANEIEKKWVRYCEPKARKMRQSLGTLKSIKNPLVTDLLFVLQGENSLIGAIQQLNVNDNHSILNLRTTFYTLMDTLKQLLIVADLHIIEIAETLSSKEL